LIDKERNRPYFRTLTDDDLDASPFLYCFPCRDILAQDIALRDFRVIFLTFDFEIQSLVGNQFVGFQKGLSMQVRYFNRSAETEYLESEIPEDESEDDKPQDIERELNKVADFSLHLFSLSNT
jgi:hypothetical protein